MSGHVVRASLFSQIRYRNALTKIALEDAEHGLGNVYRSVRENQEIVRGNCCLSATCFTNSDIFDSNSRARPPENRKFKSPAGIRFSLWKKNSSQRERRKWSLGLGHNLKALGLTCVRSQSSREINNATKSEFSTFLKINKPRIQFLLRSTRFYPG